MPQQMHPKKTRILGILLLLNSIGVSLLANASSQNLQDPELSIQELYEGFQDPPAEARPFVRWWWSNNQVEIEQVERELDVFKDAGIGGVEINPILDPQTARLRQNLSKAPFLRWLTPEWNEVLRESAKAAKERGMIVDLLGGSGWPFGGHFLQQDETAYRLVVHYDKVSGPTTHNADSSEIFKRKASYTSKHYGKARNATEAFAFIKLVPTNMDTFEEIISVEPVVGDDGALQIEIPEGDYIISYGVLEQNFRMVGNAVSGADGPALNHFSQSATEAYMDNLFSIENSWGEPLSNHIRAIFSDSIEIAESNYDPGMFEEFKENYGYDIVPYLSLALMPEKHVGKLIQLASDQTSELRRARYDWFSFVISRFLSGFPQTFTDYLDAKGMQGRYQSGGNPVFMGIQEGSMISHIPEAENWIHRDDYLAHRSYHSKGWRTHTVNAKYNAAAANLQGKRIVSSESMTNVAYLFKATLAQMKQALDANFIAGLNHTVFHGATYSPPDVPFPGLIRFGTFFSPNNTWWPYFRHFAEYNARLSYVFQNTQTVPEVAVLGKAPDVWAKSGLGKVDLTVTPRYYGDLWKTFAELGVNNDYIHGAILEEADMSNGLIEYGPMAYELLIVIENEAIAPETAEAIQTFAEAGGTVVFVGTIPSQAPELSDASESDQRVQRAIEVAIEAGAIKVPAPTDHNDMNHLRNWLAQTLDAGGYKSAIQFEDPKEGVYAKRKQIGETELLFFTNTFRREPYQTRVEYALGDKGLWVWDPTTGEASPHRFAQDSKGFNLELAPLESVLLVTGPKHETAEVTSRYPVNSRALEIGDTWSVHFDPINDGDAFDLTFDELSGFEKHTDARVQQFAGVATYTTEFQLDGNSYTYLDLGDTNDDVAEIWINEKPAGINWYGSKRFDISEHLKPGKNSITIRYTTTLYNGMLENPIFLDLRKVWKFIKVTGPEPSGLLGPIRLISQ